MDRTPEEIKKGLECCTDSDGCYWDNGCPYGANKECSCDLKADALAYIQQLEPIKALVEQYIQKYKICCSESIWQMDKPQLGAIELADKLCRLVGYMEETDE